jgi:PDZ domain-containing secreted protein
MNINFVILVQSLGKLNMKTIQIQKVNNILKFIIALLLPYQTLVPFMSAKCMYMQYTHSEFIVK